MTTSSDAPPPSVGVKSSRDMAALPGRLEAWLATRLPDSANPRIVDVSAPTGSGMSTETLIFRAEWAEGGTERQEGLVARIPPYPEDMPVFPVYDMPRQFTVMSKVRELRDVPVPEPMWLEEDASVVGQPFMVMRKVDGEVPADNPLYIFGDSWVYDAEPAQQATLRDSSVAVLAGLHSIPDATTTFGFLDPGRHGHPGESLLERDLARTRHWYDYAAADIGRSPLAERALAWLEAHVPETDPIDDVLCWGDARIGNMIFRDFEPVAVLDWEMACLGPRELDVSWMVFAHRVFESIAGALELPGMPDFLREEDVVAHYEELTGARLRDLTWYHVFNGLQWCIVFMRTGARQIHFGEIERPDEVDSLMHCGPLVSALLDEVGA